ncbi:MAG: hypothetical protein IJ872_02845 [Eubacterium sp.]|nr:hypothetical protein [Eubacterium sp.]MBR2278129.1 hypothetical protein [Eubacterium sp.]
MYQSPDLVKVDLEIKDNFAAYGQTGCYRNSWTAYTINEMEVPTGLCERDRVITYASGETDYQCFISKNSY